MTRILCLLGWHRWSCYAIDSDAHGMIFQSHCLRCAKKKELRAGTPPVHQESWRP